MQQLPKMSTTAAKTKKTEKKPARVVAGDQRSREIVGLILMVIAALLSLALISYSEADRPLTADFSLSRLLYPGTQQANNALGLLGAFMSNWLVPSFLGYNVLLLTGLLFGWGYVVFRQKAAHALPSATVLVILTAFLAALFFGWLGLTLDSDLQQWSGLWGLGIARWLRRIIGSTGALALILLSLAVIGLIAIDRDIQHWMDRIEGLGGSVGSRLHAWRARRAAARAARPEKEPDQPLEATWADARKQRAPAAAEAGARPANGSAPPKPPAAPISPRVPVVAPEEISGTLSLRDMLSEEERASLLPLSDEAPVRRAPRQEESGQPVLKIQERVEEERADVVARRSDVPRQAPSYSFPSIDLLDRASEQDSSIDLHELEENKRVLLDKLETYKIEIVDINAIVGPTVTLYELTPAPGVKISRITALEDDLAMAMAAKGIRMIAPIPGKSAIGIEIPNRHRELVRIRDLIGTARFRDVKMELPVAIGKTVEGEVFIEDLTRCPHLLIAGATGSGKSVGVNTLITSLLYSCHPANLKFVMIDPKKIELQQYGQLVNHYGAMPPYADEPIITDFQEALGVLKSCEKEMERRYDMLSKATVRGVKDYNKKVASGQLKADQGHVHLPYIVVIVDELADLMMTAGKEIEGPIARLAQMARAVGIHLVLATQRPSVDVITGLIKANFPSRIAYQVASKVDSRTILDQNGAEGLVGNGDLLYMNGSRVVRLQGPFVSVDEVEAITNFVQGQRGQGPYELPPVDDPADASSDHDIGGMDDIDDLFDEAARVIVRSQQGSVSLLQRKLSVGYARAARIVDQLEEAGIVGPFEGSKARQVLVADEFLLDKILKGNREA